MPLPQMGRPKSPQEEALEALMAQQPEQSPAPSMQSTPPRDVHGQNPFVYNPERRGTDPRYDEREGPWGRSYRPQEDIVLEPEPTPPSPPPAPNLQGAGPRPPQLPSYDETVREGRMFSSPTPSPFADVTPENAAQGLAGLYAAQGDQFSPFGEMELHQMASRDPSTVAPGSNQMWAGKLQEMQSNRLQADAMQRRALEGINAAIQGTHPAVQFQQEQEARRKAMPAQITAQGQFRAAQEAADSRRDVGEANLEGRSITAEHDTVNTILDVIRALRTRQAPLNAEERNQLRALENLYDQMSSGLTDTSFAEAYEGIERP